MQVVTYSSLPTPEQSLIPSSQPQHTSTLSTTTSFAVGNTSGKSRKCTPDTVRSFSPSFLPSSPFPLTSMDRSHSSNQPRRSPHQRSQLHRHHLRRSRPPPRKRTTHHKRARFLTHRHRNPLPRPAQVSPRSTQPLLLNQEHPTPRAHGPRSALANIAAPGNGEAGEEAGEHEFVVQSSDT